MEQRQRSILEENWRAIRTRVEAACRRSERDPQSVRMIAVSKTVPVQWICEAAALGLRDFGESRVQEMRDKRANLAEGFPDARWHLIGHLQRNKVPLAVDFFNMIHSVDSVELADTLNRCAGSRRKPRPAGDVSAREPNRMDVFVQVNISGESTKRGCTPREATALARRILQMPHVKLRGLMTIAPYDDDPDAARPWFRALRTLRDDAALGLGIEPSKLELSMGMSHDFEAAIEEGADWIRIGTALFGERPYS